MTKENAAILISVEEFWCKHEASWLELETYAKNLSSIPTTSTAVERCFSVEGAIFDQEERLKTYPKCMGHTRYITRLDLAKSSLW